MILKKTKIVEVKYIHGPQITNAKDTVVLIRESGFKIEYFSSIEKELTTTHGLMGLLREEK